jgi:hypothetical protein
MTTLDTARPGFLSHEAALGARRQKLAEIDRFFDALVEDIHAEHAAAWASGMAASCERIKVITDRVTVTAEGVLQGPDLIVFLAVKHLMDEWEKVAIQKLRLDHVRDMALEDTEKLRLEQRAPYDFTVPLAVVAS